MKKPSRSEQEVFDDLAALCCRPGYIHAIAYFCFRDNVVLYDGYMRPADLEKTFSSSQLIRTEIDTLLGLLIKGAIDWTLPASETMQEYIDNTEQLLEELHNCLGSAFFSDLTPEKLKSGNFDPFEKGDALREPVFYSGEAAYHFQYLDLASRKYAADSTWLLNNFGFTIDQATKIAYAIEKLHAEHFNELREVMHRAHPDEWTVLPLFTFTQAEVAAKTDVDTDTISRILDAFALPSNERNTQFNSLQDFNALKATPLIRAPCEEYLALQSYALAEAIYETPFYWMAQDESYLPSLSKHRGEFTEHFVAERLRLIFGSENVFLNVKIFQSKTHTAAETDVLVIWGDRVIVVQAKSKQMTLAARKGNDRVIRNDFKQAIQVAYDQGAACAEELLNQPYKLVQQDGNELSLPRAIKEIYLFCVVSDHYPALSFQARRFLDTRDIDRVQPPLVMDVFAIDAITEMLQSPLQFLSYINRRTNFADQLLASQELTILGYHLTNNLWLSSTTDLLHLSDDLSADLDIAMAVRRAGIQGDSTPDGILTRFQRTTVGRVVREIEARPDPTVIDLGFQLLALSEDAINNLSEGIDLLAARGRADGQAHDITVPFPDGTGITVHCTDQPPNVAAPRLKRHCEQRKYRQRADTWFGLCMNLGGPTVRFGVTVTYPWSQDSEMYEATRHLPAPMPTDQAIEAIRKGRKPRRKIGRNEPCPCGSGRKYKKCCL